MQIYHYALEEKQNLYNLKRNTKFHKVVHDRRMGLNQLVCKTDDFIFTADLADKTCNSVHGIWSPYEDDLVNLEYWNDVSHDHEHRKDLSLAKAWWKQTLFDLRSGRKQLNVSFLGQQL